MPAVAETVVGSNDGAAQQCGAAQASHCATTRTLVRLIRPVIGVLASPRTDSISKQPFTDRLRTALIDAIMLRRQVLASQDSESSQNVYINMIHDVLAIPRHRIELSLQQPDTNSPAITTSGSLVSSLSDTILPLEYLFTCFECLLPVMSAPVDVDLTNIQRNIPEAAATSNSDAATPVTASTSKPATHNGNKGKTIKPKEDVPLVLRDDFVLGVKDTANCKTLLEIILVWGISSSSNKYKNDIIVSAFMGNSISMKKVNLDAYCVTPITQFHVTMCLSRFVQQSIDAILSHGANLLLNKFAAYLLLSLLQVCYDPDWLNFANKGLDKNKDGTESLGLQHLVFWNTIMEKESNVRQLTSSDRDQAKMIFEKLFFSLRTGTMVNALISLLPVTRQAVRGASHSTAWLKRCLGNLLTVLIMRPNKGIRAVISAFHDRLDEERNESLIQESLSTLLLSVPASQTREDYFDYVGKELFLILTDFDSQSKGVESFAYRSSIYIAQQLLNKDEKIAIRTIFNPILEPLSRFWISEKVESKVTETDLDGRYIECSEDELEDVIEFIIYSISIVEPQASGPSKLWNIYQPIMSILFSIAFNTANTIFNARIKSAIETFFRMNFELNRNQDTQSLPSENIDGKNMVLGVLHDLYESISTKKHCLFRRGGTGRLHFVKALNNEEFASEPILIPALDFVDFLDSMKLDGFMGMLFLDSFEYQTVVSNDKTKDFLNQVLLSVLSKFDDPRTLLKDPSRIVRFASTVLLAETKNYEMMELALALLSTIFVGSSGSDDVDSDDESEAEESNEKIDEYIDLTDPMFKSTGLSVGDMDKKASEAVISMISVEQLDELLLILRTLSEDIHSSIKQMAEDLRLKIVSLRIQLNSRASDDKGAPKDIELEKSRKRLRVALKDFNSNLIPVRAHGVTVVRQMILARDPAVKGEVQPLALACLELLRDKDSFVYLNVVKTLAALTDVYPEATLKLIVSQYTHQAHDLDYRLQIGETLLRTIQRCGEVFPRYSEKILPQILITMRDSDKNLRSSAMSLISCISENAPLSLLPVLSQLLSYLVDIIQLESKTPETTRAATHTVFQILDNVGDKGFELIPMNDIKRLQKLFIGLEGNVRGDHIVRSHAAKTLEAISYWIPTSQVNKS